MYLNNFKPNSAYANIDGTVISFEFSLEENPTMEDYKVRSKILAYCVAHYPLCVSGAISEPVNGIVTARFVRG